MTVMLCRLTYLQLAKMQILNPIETNLKEIQSFSGDREAASSGSAR